MGLPGYVDIPDKVAHPVKDLESVRLPVTDIHESVVGYPKTVRQRRDVSFGLGSVKRPLTEEPTIAVHDRNPLVPCRGFSIGDVDVAGLVIHVDAGRQKELGTVGIQWTALACAIRGVIHTRFPDLEQELTAIARVLPDHTGSGRDDPYVLVLVDVTVMKPIPYEVGVSPGADDISTGVELDHRRGQTRGIQVLRNHILPIEDEHMIAAVDAHSAQTAREPSIGERQFGPERIDLVSRDLWCLGSHGMQETNRNHQ